MTLLLAGHETTATGAGVDARPAASAIPHVLDRLTAEVEAGDEAYLRAVVSESLRLRRSSRSPAGA